MYLVAEEEDPHAVDQEVHQAGAHPAEEEEAHQVVEASSPSEDLEFQEEVEESWGGIPLGSLMGLAAKLTPL